MSGLLAAVEYGYTDIVLLLLKAGACVDQSLDDGTTALMMAVEKKMFDITRSLLEFGATPLTQNKVSVQ